jgi:hypothetical protein
MEDTALTQTRNRAAQRMMDTLGLSEPGAATCVTVLQGGEMEFALYALADRVVHRITGRRDPIPETPGDTSQVSSDCTYKALPITAAATFSLTLTAGGVNGAPERRSWHFQFDPADESITFCAPADAEFDADGPLAFAAALAKAITQQPRPPAGTEEAEEAREYEHA